MKLSPTLSLLLLSVASCTIAPAGSSPEPLNGAAPSTEAAEPDAPSSSPPGEVAPVANDDPADAFAVIGQMGLGFSLGRVFDQAAPALTTTEAKEIVDLYYAAGFRHVRFPVTWMDDFDGDHLADADGRVDFGHERFLRLETLVNYALSKSMYVIINTHHEMWLKDGYDGTSSYAKKFSNLWTNIAKHFASHSHRLIFEVLNEPERAFGDIDGPVSPYGDKTKAMTRAINEVGYEAIRNSEKANASRIVMVMPNAQGNQTLFDDVYPTAATLPGQGKDRFLAVSVHTYDPWSFCGETGSNESWPGPGVLTDKVNAAAKHAKKLGVAVNYGEFGVGRTTKQEERNADIVREYYRTTASAIRANGMSGTLWDDRGWFALVEKNESGAFAFKYGLAKAALQTR